jgi:hypothetical protein
LLINEVEKGWFVAEICTCYWLGFVFHGDRTHNWFKFDLEQAFLFKWVNDFLNYVDLKILFTNCFGNF